MHPGTFNPPHRGHVEGASAAFDVFCSETKAQHASPKQLIHAITLDPPNKARVTTAEALDRAIMLGDAGCDTLLSQGDPLFVDKAARFHGTSFVVGADTVIRMLDPQWGIAPADVLHALESHSTRLYVLGRNVTNAAGETTFVTLEHPWIQKLIPSGYSQLFRHVPGRWDVSSSALRASAHQ